MSNLDMRSYEAFVKKKELESQFPETPYQNSVQRFPDYLAKSRQRRNNSVQEVSHEKLGRVEKEWRKDLNSTSLSRGEKFQRVL